MSTPHPSDSADGGAIWTNPETRRVLDTVADMFVALDRDYCIVFANEALIHVSRIGVDLVGRNHWDLWPDMRGTVVETEYASVLQSGVPSHFEFHYPALDLWIRIDAYRIGSYLHVYFRNITDEKKIESERAEVTATLYHLLDAIPHIAWATDPGGSIVYINARWKEFTGVDGTEQDAIRSCIHPEDLPRITALMQRARETGKFTPYDLRVRSRDGSFRWHRVKSSAMTDNAGQTTAWIGTSTDVHEEVLAIESLRKAEAASQAIVNGMAEPVSVFNAGGEMVATNAAWNTIHGDLGTEAAVSTFNDTFEKFTLDGHPLPMADWPVTRALAGEAVRSVMIRARNRSTGTEFVASYSAVPVASPSEGFVVVTAHDMTDMIATEEALRFSESRYRVLTESMPQISFMATPDGELEFANRRFFDYTGLDPKSDLTQVWESVMHPDDLAEVGEAWQSAQAAREPWECEYRMRGANGAYRWFLGRSSPLQGENGEVLRWFGAAADIHRQKMAEQELEATIKMGQVFASELDTELIVQALTDAATEASGAEFGSFFYNAVNEKGDVYLLYTLSGVPKDAFSNFPMPRPTAVFGPTFRGEGPVRSDDITQDPRYGLEEPYRGMPEGHLPVRSYLALPVISRSGEVIGGLFFGHSKTGIFTEGHERLLSAFAAQAAVALDNARLYERERRVNEELETRVDERTAALLAANEKLEVAYQEAESFSYAASHDLRAPLRAVIATSMMMEEDFGDDIPEEARRLLRRQVAAGKRLANLIEDLLGYSRFGRQEVRRERFNLSAVVSEAATELDGRTDIVHIHIEPGLEAFGDAALVRIVIQNLLENAITYSPMGGDVRFGRDEKVEGRPFFISDQGIGLEMRFAEKIFEPFQRLHRDEEYKGTGIGLANTRKIIERHGGTIWVDSTPGNGATFYFTLGPGT